MRIIVGGGAGLVGYSIAEQLVKEGHDVTVIDESVDRVKYITDDLDVNAFVGHAAHPNILENAGASHADMLIAVTGSDEVNMISCQVAYSLFNIPTKIARIRHANYLTNNCQEMYKKDHLPVDVIISPEIEVAKAVNQRLHVPGAIDTIPFAKGKVRVVAIRCSNENPVLKKKISIIRHYAEMIGVAILGVFRDGEKFIFDDDDELLLQDDVLFFISDKNNTQKAMSLFGYEEKEASKILIIGGGNIGLNLAKYLEEENPDNRIKIIELNNKRAEFIAQKLGSHTSVINGSALEYEILEEANIESIETSIAVSNNDQVNILASLLAKRFGCNKTLALVNSNSYSPIMSTLGIDVTLSPRETTVSSVLQHVRRGKIHSVHSICNGTVEIIEVEAMDSSSVIGVMIKDLGIPSGAQVGFMIRGSSTIIPEKETLIQSGDVIIVICLSHLVTAVEQIFSIKFEYF